jgi:hypothetical protein
MPGTINQIGNQILNNSFIIGDTNNNIGLTADLKFQKSRSYLTISAGDYLGTIAFEGHDGVNFISGAEIKARSQVGVALGVVPTKLYFSTASTTTIIPKDRMTIADKGNVAILAPDSGIALTISAGGTTSADGGISFPLNSDNRIFVAGTLYEHSTSIFGDSVYLGPDAGNINATGGGNVGIGQAALNKIQGGTDNVAIGVSALVAATSAGSNIAIGSAASLLLTSGTANITLGFQAGILLLTGNRNILLGYAAGSNYLAAESSNIIIGDTIVGVGGESNVTRIDNIYGTTVGATQAFAVVDNTDKLGSKTLTSTGGTIVFSATASTLNLEVSGSGESWHEVTAATQQLVCNNGYILNRATLITTTLPTAADGVAAGIGATIAIMGKGLGGWLIAQNALQNINFGSSPTAVGVGGSLASTNQWDSVTLVLIDAAGLVWAVQSSIGNLTVV